MKARQHGVPSGMRMRVSPMTVAGVDKGLSQAGTEAPEKMEVTSMGNDTCDPEEVAEEEGRKAVVRRGVEGPTKKEREEHEATHCPYRSWCRHCVRGRGRNSLHFKKKEEERDKKGMVARVSMDYFSIIVMIDESTGSVYARAHRQKGNGGYGLAGQRHVGRAEKLGPCWR